MYTNVRTYAHNVQMYIHKRTMCPRAHSLWRWQATVGANVAQVQGGVWRFASAGVQGVPGSSYRIAPSATSSAVDGVRSIFIEPSV